MDNQEGTLSQKHLDEQQTLREDLIREVLKGAPSGMDKDSLLAAAALLLEVETNKALIHLLQTGEISGRVDNDGEVELHVERVDMGPMKAEAA